MKKNIYIVAATAAVLIVTFLLATQSYRASKQAPEPKLAGSKPAADLSVLLRSDSPSLGPMLARVTVVEFLDPECESCREMHPLTKRIMKEYEGRVRLVVRYMPLHRNSLYAATVLEAAGEQGRYWEMLDILFQHQREWGDKDSPQAEFILQLAARIGLDMKALERSLLNPAHETKVQRDFEDGKKVGVTGTPTFFVNGTMLRELGSDPLKALINKELAR